MFRAGFLFIEEKEALKRLDNFDLDFDLRRVSIDECLSMCFSFFRGMMMRYILMPSYDHNQTETK